MTVYTEDEITAAALAYFRITFQNSAKPIDLTDRGFCGLLARAFARFLSWRRVRFCKPTMMRFLPISKTQTVTFAVRPAEQH